MSHSFNLPVRRAVVLRTRTRAQDHGTSLHKTNPIPQKAARSGARFRANPLGEILAYPSCRCRRFFLR